METRRRIGAGEIPGPRMFISGPFLQRAPYEPWQADYRWGLDGAEDARAKTRTLVEAGVDVIELIDQDQLTDAEVAAVVETAHAAGSWPGPRRTRSVRCPTGRSGSSDST